MSCDLRLEDLLELSRVFAQEYNMPELHDRVLVFDVMQNGWETKTILNAMNSNIGNDSTENVESQITVLNEVPRECVDNKTENNSDGGDVMFVETSHIVKRDFEGDIESGSTSRQDSSAVLGNESNDHDPGELTQGSTISAEHAELAEKGIIRQHKIYVHSSWLAVQSKYFRSLFYSGTYDK